jgi:glycosyltransferase involved in cell wall biosynthesis
MCIGTCRPPTASCFPTEDEAFGIALIEALACGLPAVTTATGGIRDIVGDGEVALVVPVGDFDGLYHALDAVLTDENLRSRLAEAGVRIARERYATRAVAARYVDLLRAAGRTRRAGRSQVHRRSVAAETREPAAASKAHAVFR